MEFCKTVKEFDCEKFEEDQLYYIHWHTISGDSVKAIYLCTVVNKEDNSITVVRVHSLQGSCPAHAIKFGNADINRIDEVQKVEFETEYDVSWREWYVRTTISPDITNDRQDEKSL